MIEEKRAKKVKFKFRLYYLEDSKEVALIKPLKLKNIPASPDAEINGASSRHWVLRLGEKKEMASNITKVLDVSEKPKEVVFIASHMHPGLNSLAIIDKSKGKVLYETGVKYSSIENSTKENIDSVPFSNATPLKFESGHDYELKVESKNIYPLPISVMAVAYLYYIDYSKKQ
jgi:hypothetical protein